MTKIRPRPDTNELLPIFDAKGGGPPVITVDYEAYAHMLDDPDLSEDQKREVLQAIWNIVVQFVSLGFGVHPVQQTQGSCGKPADIAEFLPLTRAEALKSKDQDLDTVFEDAADGNTHSVAKRTPK
jgi:hypothetical protein